MNRNSANRASIASLAFLAMTLLQVERGITQPTVDSKDQRQSKKLVEIASKFVSPDNSKAAGFTVVEKGFFTGKDGSVIHEVVVQNIVSLKIDPQKDRVVAWQSLRSSMPATTVDGKPITREEFVSELVAVPDLKAVSKSVQFLEQRFQDLDFSRLTLEPVKKRTTGQGFYWVISWRDTANENGYHVGKIWVNVMVNPIDGEIVSGLFLSQEVNQKPRLQIGEVRRHASTELQSTGMADCVEEKSIRLVEGSSVASIDKLEWRIEYRTRNECEGVSGFGRIPLIVIRVRDSNGQILH